MKPSRYTIQQFHEDFPDNDTCLATLFAERFGSPKCEACGRVGAFHKHPSRPCYSCNCGKTHLFPKAGTIFEKSSTDLVKWFFAIFLMSQSRNGVAAKEIERHAGVTYKTAWRMAHEIRKLMDDGHSPLSGEIEADETYIGGVQKGQAGRRHARKTVVFGAVERGGRLNTAVVPDASSKSLGPHLASFVAKGSHLLTDTWAPYKSIARSIGAIHRTVRHGAKEWVSRDGTHTNNIESFWSQLKRSIDGTHHVISTKYAPLYVAEFEWRYNARTSPIHMFRLLLGLVATPA
jgi:transposase